MPISISITSGKGYFGSVYTQTGAAGAGQWHADGVAIPGATGNTYTMESKNEGKKITFRTTSPNEISNGIKLHTPDQISGLQAWWDASRDDLMTKDGGGAVALVTPRAGSQPTLTLSQSTAASKPIWSATARNGKPGWTGDGVDDIFVIDNGATLLPVGTTPSHFGALAYCGASTGTSWRGLFTSGSTTVSRSPARDNLGNMAWGGFSASFDTKTTITWVNSDRIYEGEFASDGIRIWADGAATPSAFRALTNPSTANSANPRMMGSNTAGDRWPGVLHDAFNYNVTLTQEQRQKNEGYLANKWGYESLLPADHPYKTVAPTDGTVAVMASSGYLPTSVSNVDTTAPGPITISIQSGTGYAGSVYTRDKGSIGQWYAGSTAIPGATGLTYTMEAKYEGKSIQFKALNGYESNRIRMFTPADVDGLLAWWDAYSPELITHSAGVVSLMTSRLPTAWTLSQPTLANRPDYSATGRNGLPAITGNGTSDYFFIDQTASLPFGTNPSTSVVLAYWSNTTPGAWKALLNWGNAANQNRTIHKDVTENVAQAGGTSTYDNRSTVNWTNKDKIVFAEDQSTGRKLNIDGGSDVVKTVAFNSPNNNSGQVFTTDFWNGSFQELLIYNKTLSLSERQRIEGYLASKWNQRALLPAGHPYKSTVPPPPGVQMDSSGYLPTQAMSTTVPFVADAAMSGYLPTSDMLADSEGLGPITISIQSGTGYAGSVYTRDRASLGQWYAGITAIPGATGLTYTMEGRYEGRTIFFKSTAGVTSNGIDLFAPNEIAGLVHQFDAYSPNTLIQSSGAVSIWGSKAPTSGYLQQTTEANKPLYNATGRNGRPVITADGTNDYFDIVSPGDGLPDTEDCTIITVAHFANVNPGAYRMLIKWGSVAAARRGIAKSDTERVTTIGGTVANNNVSTVTWPNADKIVSGNYQSLGTVMNVDGGADIVKVASYSTPDQASAYVFRDSTLYWNGGAQEILIWNRTLTNDERQKVEGYLASKWGLRALLPSGHPYKSTNPPAGRSDMASNGYLPTSASYVTVPVVATIAGSGYLPTQNMVAGQAINATMASSGFLGQNAGNFASFQYNGSMASFGYLPTSDAQIGFPQKINAAMVGYLPTQNMRAGYPLRITMDSMGLLPTSLTWLATRTTINVAMTGFLPTQASLIDQFDYTVEAEMRGFLGESELGSNGLYKIDMDGFGRLPTSASEIYQPQELNVTSVMRGYLATMSIAASLSMEAEIVTSGYLPVMDAELGRAPYLITMDSWGYLAKGHVGGSGDRPYASSPGFTTGGGINIGGGPTFTFGGSFRIG